MKGNPDNHAANFEPDPSSFSFAKCRFVQKHRNFLETAATIRTELISVLALAVDLGFVIGLVLVVDAATAAAFVAALVADDVDAATEDDVEDEEDGA